MIPSFLHTIQKPLVWICIMVFAINQSLERVWNIFIPYIHAYLDDLLCMPIILGLSTQIIQWIHPAREYYYLSKAHIIIAVLFFSLVFELLYPVMYPETYTADPFDMLCYGFGGVIFYWFVARESKKAWEKSIAQQHTTTEENGIGWKKG